MDIYDYAMQMEKDGESYYRELSRKTVNPGLKSILTKLADAEVKHYEVFRSMKLNEDIPETETEILSHVKNIFVKMKEQGETDVDVSQIDLYKKAQEIETKSRDFYLEKADEVENSRRGEIFLKIADEEKKHYLILENIIDFISRPSQWLENPEWYHLDEY